MKGLLAALLLVLGLVSQAQATSYFISSTGSNSNDGLSASAPFLTFTYATDASRASCGDTLNLADGVYGDGASTGKLSLVGRICTLGDELTIRATNQRQARIHDNGTGDAISLTALTAYIIFDGIVANSTSNSGDTTHGNAFSANNTDHITIKNSLFRNPNKHANTYPITFANSRDALIEDTEIYDFHRHAILFYTSKRMVARRVFGHERDGWLAGVTIPSVTTNPTGKANALVSMYPCEDCIQENTIADGAMSLNEMNATGGLSVAMRGKIYGSICVACDHGNGIYPNPRTAGTIGSPTDTVVENTYINFVGTNAAISHSDGVNSLFDHITLIGSSASTDPAMFNRVDASVGSSNNSVTMRNMIAQGFTNEIGFYQLGYTTWSGDEIYSFNNATAFSPAVPSNWTNTATTDPGLGDCRVFIPDGAAAKGAGTGGSDIGANTLYRYADGILTTTPLWDPTTGEFPHGATDLDGTNDNVGESLLDVHKRLNVPFPGDTHACNFPASFPGGGTPANPATMVTSEGTTSTSHSHTLPAGLDFLLQCIVLHDSGGNVGNVNAATSGAEALTLIATSVTSPAYRRAALYRRTAPTTGAQTQAVTTTGTVTGMRTTSIEAEGYSAIGSNATATNLSSTPSVTVTTNTNETIFDCLGAKKTITLTAGANQTLQRDDAVTTTDLRSAVSTQSGTNGGVMSHTMGSNNYWAQVAVSMLPTVPDPPPTNTLTVTKYGVFSGFGTEAGATALAATSTAASIAPNGMARVRAEITAAVATNPPFGFSLYCQKTSEGVYRQIVDTFGSSVVRLEGSGLVQDLPASLTPTTPRLTAPDGNSVVGAMLRDQASVFIAPQMASGKKIEMEWVIVANATASDTIQCQPRFDSGVALTTYTVTPTINVIPPSASGIAQADQPTGLSVHLDPSMPRWPLVGSLGDARKNF